MAFVSDSRTAPVHVATVFVAGLWIVGALLIGTVHRADLVAAGRARVEASPPPPPPPPIVEAPPPPAPIEPIVISPPNNHRRGHARGSGRSTDEAVSGPLPRNRARPVFRAAAARVRSCLGGQGRVDVGVTVAADGTVTSVPRVDGAPDLYVESCVRDIVLELSFPESGASSQQTFAYSFRARRGSSADVTAETFE